MSLEKIVASGILFFIALIGFMVIDDEYFNGEHIDMVFGIIFGTLVLIMTVGCLWLLFWY